LRAAGSRVRTARAAVRRAPATRPAAAPAGVPPTTAAPVRVLLAGPAPARVLLAVATLLLAAPGCRQDMHDQPRYKPLAESAFFADGRASRPLVPGTVARGHLDDDALLTTGVFKGKLAEVFPFPVTRAVLERGRERFDIYCSPCHDRVGDGNGMIVQRGFKRPPSLHEERLRVIPVGRFFDVITNGFASMPSYAAQIPPRDRWAIAAYIRALQLSQHTVLAEWPPAVRAALTRSLDVTASPAPERAHE
jgi:Cytochrome C oxidase, cbb3-type, subunit III